MTCATCGSALDVRAPLVRVRGTSVVAFCSTDCLEGRLPEPPAPAPVPSEAALAVAAPVQVPLRSPTPARRTLFWSVARVFVGATVAGALIGVLIEAVPSRPETAAATPAPLSAPAPGPPEPPLRDRARAVLDRFSRADDPDLAFQATLALARLGDPAALASLRGLVPDAHNPRRFRAAEWLAGQGDAGALAMLRSRLASSRREERAAAARALAQAGDASGREGLRDLLRSRLTRVGAACALAALGDEQAVGLLRDALESDALEARARAAVALGRRGDRAAVPELRRLLSDRRFEVGAAVALSYVADSEARPALLQSLRHSALRVEAAESLLRLGADPGEALADGLADALAEESPAGRISAAHAILLLSGAR